jgi:hypothetical protein
MWLAPESKPSIEEALFKFLTTVAEGSPRAIRLMVAENATLREVYANPHPLLERRLHHCVDCLLVEMSLDPKQWGKLKVPSWMIGLALALNNCLVPNAPKEAEAGFTSALIESLSPTRQLAEIFTSHALLRNALAIPSRRPRSSDPRVQALLERSPLTALWFLHEYTPTALHDLARELVPGFRAESEVKRVWENDEDWLNIISTLLDNSDVARIVRQRWLVIPESRRACRNIGLLLEALRRRGSNREFCLEFYEAYDYFRSELRDDAWSGQVRVWPLLKTIEELLLVPGDSEAAVQVNRWGNEYFLKFRPLMEIIVAEAGLPRDYSLLTLAFAQSMGHLLPYITENVPAVSFGEVTFNSHE